MKTFKQIRDFNNAVEAYYRRVPDAIKTKIGYAIRKVSDKENAKILKDYNTELSEIRDSILEKAYIDHALTDKVTGAVLLAPRDKENPNARPYLYDKAGLQTVMKAEREFEKKGNEMLEQWDVKEFEITPHITSEIPDDLTDIEKEAFMGFVLEDAPAPKKSKKSE